MRCANDAAWTQLWLSQHWPLKPSRSTRLFPAHVDCTFGLRRRSSEPSSGAHGATSYSESSELAARGSVRHEAGRCLFSASSSNPGSCPAVKMRSICFILRVSRYLEYLLISRSRPMATLARSPRKVFSGSPVDNCDRLGLGQNTNSQRAPHATDRACIT